MIRASEQFQEYYHEELGAATFPVWSHDHMLHGMVIRQKVDYTLYFVYHRDIYGGRDRMYVSSSAVGQNELPAWITIA